MMNRGYAVLLTGCKSFRLQPKKLLKMSSRFASRLVYHEHGQPNEVIKLETFPEPTEVEDDNVIVRMLATPVNPADINTIQGVYAISPPLPATGGGDGIGEVLQVGPKVKDLKPGDRVFPGGSMKGTWTTHYIDSEKNLVKTRKDLPLLSAATLRVNPGTAYRMLKDFVKLEKDDFVIQNGANSAVGQNVIEIAKALGVKTVNIVRDRPNIDELKDDLKKLGADIVWTEEELRKAKEFRENKLPKPKLALNCVGGESSLEILRTLDHKGVHVTYGGMSMKPVTVPTATLIFKDISVRGFWMSQWIKENFENPDRLKMYEELAEMAHKGQLSPPKNIFAPIKDYQEIMENTVKGFKAGKYIIDLS